MSHYSDLSSVKQAFWKGRLAKDGVRKAVAERQSALTDLVHAIQKYRRLADSTSSTLQGPDYACAVKE